jgi:site-specific recombinase XerD
VLTAALLTRSSSPRTAGASTRARSAVSCPTHRLGTLATHLLEGGATPHDPGLLGHASLSTTQVYSHVDARRLRKVYDSSHPRS